MKRTMMFAGLLVVVLVVLFFGVKSVSTADASVVTSGTPVICNSSLPPETGYPLTCRMPDGSTFTTVPASNYFFVTDVYVVGSPSGSWTSSIEVSNFDGSLWGTIDHVALAGSAGENKGEHFTTPAMLVLADQKIVVTNGASVGSIYVKVTGMLTTNYAYLPLILR